MENNVQLPPGMNVTASSAGIPYGAGRPIRPDPSTKDYLARAEISREQKASAGRPTIFKDGDELRHACLEYFQWVDTNPLLEQQVQFSAKQAAWAKTDKTKKRPYTQGGLCYYLAIPQKTWIDWRRSEKFARVVKEIDDAIYRQKFEGASSGFFNVNIIARDLGLADKQEITGPGGGPQETITTTMTPAEAAEAYAKTREE